MHPGDLGRRLVERRAELGLARDVVAERAGVDPYYLEYLEREGSTCTATTLEHLAVALATTPDVLRGSDSTNPSGLGPRPMAPPRSNYLIARPAFD